MIIHGDCSDVLYQFEENTFDALITDPPAGISFMGKEWDSDKGGRKQWMTWFYYIMHHVKHVMKPGAHGLVWALPKTSHWTATALEEAGFEIRDRVSHLFGTGFPKGVNISKAWDKHLKKECVVIGKGKSGKDRNVSMKNFPKEGSEPFGGEYNITEAASDEAKNWEGWNTALKPACEDWWLVRKPLSEKTIVKNIEKWGVGAINIDDCRVSPTGENLTRPFGNGESMHSGYQRPWMVDPEARKEYDERKKNYDEKATKLGRYPANLVLSHPPECKQVGMKKVKKGGGLGGSKVDNKILNSRKYLGNNRDYYSDKNGMETVENWECVDECPVKMLDEQSGVSTSKGGGGNKTYGSQNRCNEGTVDYGDSLGFGDKGGASRFFYQAKPSKKERGEYNNHPTVKSIKLMEYLIKLVTPPGGKILDPFAGSGTTLLAAEILGFDCVGIEQETDYVKIIEKRLEALKS